MKTLLLLLFLCLVAPLQLAGAWLEWDRNPETNVVGYRVYSGLTSRVYYSVLDVSNSVSAPINIPPNVEIFFAVTAYNADGLESDFSEEISYTWRPPPEPPTPPTRIRITATNEIVSVTLELLESENLVDWLAIFTTNTIPAVDPRKFYRAASRAD